MLDIYGLKQFLRKYYPSHREGIGREVLFQWNPEWLKNGERRTYEARELGLITDPAQVQKAITKVKVVPMRSFVAGYYSILQGYWQIATGSTNSLNDTGGTSRSVPSTLFNTLVSSARVMDMDAATAVSTYGVVFGSNNTAVTRTDTKLNTQINHGTTSTTLNHGATSVAAPTNPSGSVTRVVISRTVTGNSGSTVSLQEDGIYINMGTSSWKFMLERNVNSFGSVAAAQNVTCTKNVDITS